jgi:hypothetical protein
MTEQCERVMVYLQQGYRPLPIIAGGKALALKAGRRAIYEKRAPTPREVARWWPPGSQALQPQTPENLR